MARTARSAAGLIEALAEYLIAVWHEPGYGRRLGATTRVRDSALGMPGSSDAAELQIPCSPNSSTVRVIRTAEGIVRPYDTPCAWRLLPFLVNNASHVASTPTIWALFCRHFHLSALVPPPLLELLEPIPTTRSPL